MPTDAPVRRVLYWCSGLQVGKGRRATPYAAVFGLISFLCVGSLPIPVSAAPGVIRAICLDSGAPKDIVPQAADAGLNVLVIHFDRFGGDTDPVALQLMREWGEAAEQSKMAYYVAIRALGPASCVGITEMKWRRCRNLFGTSLAVVCPVDRDYWRQVVAKRVESVARLCRDVRIDGVLLSLYRNWTTERHSFDSCFCDSCVGRFFDAEDFTGEDKAAHAEDRSCDEKLSLIRRGLALAPYHERQADAVAEIVRNEIGSSSALSKDFAVGLFDCGDTWLGRAVMKGLIRNEKPVLVGMDFAERVCMVDLAGACKARWAYAKLRTKPVVYLDVTYFLPEDVAHELALLKDRDIPFCITHTRGWWDRKDEGGARPALGTTGAYLKAIKGNAKAEGERKFFFGRKRHPLIPRVALIHGEKWSWAACKLVADKLKNLDVYPDFFPAWGAEGLEKGLGYYDVLVLAPGYEKAERDFFRNVTHRLDDYLRRGGVLLVLGADANEKVGFLRDIGPECVVRVSSELSSRKGSLNRKERVVLGPIPVKEAFEGKAYLTGFEGKYTSLVSREAGGSYLLRKDVGKGMVLVAPGKAISFEFVANLWVWHRSRSESLVVRLMSGMRRLRVGENRLRIGVGDQRLGDASLCVQLDVLSPDAKRIASRSAECLSAVDGEDIPLEFQAQTSGRHLLVVTVYDPESKWVFGRRILPLDIPLPIRLDLAKNYYTAEEDATLRVGCDPVECSPEDVKLVLEGNDQAACERTGVGMDYALFRVPLKKALPGSLRLIASARGLSATRALIKREPREGETKIIGGRILSFLNKTVLPIGMFGVDPVMGKDLAEAGLTVAVSGGDAEAIRAAEMEVVAEPTPERLAESANYLAWDIGDEVDHGNLTAQDVAALYQQTKEKDPYRPVVLGLSGDLSKSFFAAYLSACDAVMISSYPLPFYRIASIGEAVHYAVNARPEKKPVWLVCQCFDWRDFMGMAEDAVVDRAPSEPELRNMVYQAFANGANGILFWRYREINSRPKLRESVKNVLAEIDKLTPILMSPDSRQQVVLRPPSSPVVYRTFDHEGKIHLLACNPTRVLQEADFELPYTIRAAALLGEEPEIVGSILHVDLQSLDAKVYVLSP